MIRSALIAAGVILAGGAIAWIVVMILPGLIGCAQEPGCLSQVRF